MLFLNDLLDAFGNQRLDVDAVRDVAVGHDGGGVGVDEHNLQALFFQRAAGLRARVVEFGRLADDDGTGTDDQYLMDLLILRHRADLP